MPIYFCDTHQITIIIEGNKRTTKVQLNNRGINQCVINRTKEIKEGTLNGCVVRKIQD